MHKFCNYVLNRNFLVHTFFISSFIIELFNNKSSHADEIPIQIVVKAIYWKLFHRTECCKNVYLPAKWRFIFFFHAKTRLIIIELFNDRKFHGRNKVLK